MALGLVMLIAWLHPMAGIWLVGCLVILFLVATVAVGPESVRDGRYFLTRRFQRLWKMELAMLDRYRRRFGGGKLPS